MRLSARLRDRRDEAGNMVIAMSVLLILTNLSLALLARTLVALHHVRISQDFSSRLDWQGSSPWSGIWSRFSARESPKSLRRRCDPGPQSQP